MKSLINLDAILNSKIIDSPWPYKVIDNVLDDSVFEKFKEAAIQLSKTSKDDDFYTDGIWPNDFSTFNLDSSLEKDLVIIADQLLSIKEKIFSQFPFYNKSKLGYFNIPRFNYSIGKVNSAIHDEGISKTMALIVYLIPEQSAGTKLYNGPKAENFVSELEWKPNRAMLMISQPGVTWHSYESIGGDRYTLNLYYEKMEALDNFERLPLERKLWFYEKFGEGKLVGY